MAGCVPTDANDARADSVNSADSTRTNRDAADATIGVPADIAAGVRPPRAHTAHRTWLIAGVFLLLTLGCSAADLVQRQRVTPSPEPETTFVPTFTPTPAIMQTLVIVTPPSDGKPGVIIIPPGMDPNAVLPELPSATPVIPVEDGIETPLPGIPGAAAPTSTSPPAPTATPTPPPTPYITVASGLVTLRTGPGVEYPQIAQLGPNIPVAIIGRSADGSWLEICCISGQSMWVAAQHVIVNNDIALAPESVAEAPPTATPTGTPTETPTPTPTYTPTPYPFELAIGPQFFPTNNEYITIWVKLYVGIPPAEEAAPNHYLTVTFEGFQRPNHLGNIPSADHLDYSAPPGSGNRVLYNYKYEYHPPDPNTLDPPSSLTPLELLGTGAWTVYVSDGAGTQLSQAVTFTTTPSNPNREIYIGWVRVR